MQPQQMQEWKRITVTLSRSEWERLRSAAQHDMRDTRNQARYILSNALKTSPSAGTQTGQGEPSPGN